jgi:hypothetical protein
MRSALRVVRYGIETVPRMRHAPAQPTNPYILDFLTVAEPFRERELGAATRAVFRLTLAFQAVGSTQVSHLTT